MIEDIRKELIDIFGNRVAFHEIERMLYSSDITSLPDMFRNQIKSMPDAVVQPVNKEEVIILINLCKKSRIPLIPRGAGTSGYGGAVPTKGGIVVDFSRFNKIVDIDNTEKAVIVEPGVIWNDLEAKLRANGLALRLYPGSAISSTVAGWVANGGGVGIGSYEYGYFKDNILEVEIVNPDGTMVLVGSDIDLVDGLAGTTGFITRVKLLVRDGQADIPVVGAFATLEAMVDLFREMEQKQLSLWEVGFKNPLNIKLTHEAIKRQINKGPVHREAKELKLPEDKFTLTFAYGVGKNYLKDELQNLVKAHGGEILENDVAIDEWAERFYGMRLKASGPSIVPSEVIIPTGKLPGFIKDIESKAKGFAYNGTLISYGREAAILGYSLDDERRRGYPLAYATSLAAIKTARKLGGRPYAIGMLLANYASDTLGKDIVLKADKLKKKVDPDYILNPGKVFPASIEKNSPTRNLHSLVKLGSNMIGLVTVIDKIFGGKPRGAVIDKKTVLGKQHFGNEVAWDALACAGCGYCRSGCTEFNAIGWESSSPRGKFHFIKEYLKGKTKLDERMGEMFFTCTTCRRCNDLCQVMTPIDEHWTLSMRPTMWQEGFNPPVIFQAQCANILTSHNPGGIPQSDRKKWMPPDLKTEKGGETAYWAGCSASFNAGTKNLAVNTMRISNKAGIKIVYLAEEEWCCGGPMFTSGCIDDLLETARHNIEEFNKRGIKTIISSCSGCYMNLAHYYPVLAKRLGLQFDIKVKHITEVINELIEQKKINMKFPVKLKVTYHDPCHIGRGGNNFDTPRKILTAIPKLELVEMAHNREDSACCGKHTMRYPNIGLPINASRLKEAQDTGATVLVTACPTCETNFRTGAKEVGAKLEIMDITDLVAESMGLPTSAFAKLSMMGSN